MREPSFIPHNEHLHLGPTLSYHVQKLLVCTSNFDVICSFFFDPVHENIHCLPSVCQGKEVSQESVKQFYENWMSRQNTLSSQEDLAESLPPPLTPPAEPSSRHAYARLRSHASKVSWGSSVSRWAFFSVWICFRSRLISNRSPNVNGTDGQSVPCALTLQLHDG